MTTNHLSASRRHADCCRHSFCAAILAVIAIVLPAGCATTVPEFGVRAQTASAPPAAYFSLQGRIRVRVGDKVESGQIRWTRLVNDERLQVFTPFGSQVAELTWGADGRVTLRRDDKTMVAGSIGELTASLLGVPLDMDAIAIWIQGIGFMDGKPVERQVGNGDVWRVTVESLQMQGVYQYAARLSAVSGDTVVRVVIDHWQAE